LGISSHRFAKWCQSLICFVVLFAMTAGSNKFT